MNFNPDVVQATIEKKETLDTSVQERILAIEKQVFSLLDDKDNLKTRNPETISDLQDKITSLKNEWKRLVEKLKTKGIDLKNIYPEKGAYSEAENN